jgi:hypothetical protein
MKTVRHESLSRAERPDSVNVRPWVTESGGKEQTNSRDANG